MLTILVRAGAKCINKNTHVLQKRLAEVSLLLMEMHDIAQLAARYVNTTDQHIFLTGKAGTGKTTFLKYIIQHTYKNTVVAAPTGIAAINAGGVTLHSLLQLPFGTFIPENISLSDANSRLNTPATLFRDRKMNSSKRKLLQELELLIIDEVSMLRADLLDCIDLVLRTLRKNSSPFGGVQILFIGDLLQLPPVVKDVEIQWLKPYYESVFFFHAKALQKTPPIRVELQKIYRQSDQDFIDLLNRLRHNEQTESDLTFLNNFYKPEYAPNEDSGYIHLTTHNYKADTINQNRLEQLDGKPFIFHANVCGDFPENMCPTVVQLQLKLGAQVMFIKNDPSGEGKFFNGKIGKISSIDTEIIKVKCEDDDEIIVGKYTWENIRYTLNKSTNDIEEKVLGSFEQFPLKLAWAVTIHKSQGLTFEKAILDLEGTFAPGQLYVALSRLTSLKGLVLASPLPAHPPEIDVVLVNFSKSFQKEEELQRELASHRRDFIIKFTSQAFDFTQLDKELYFHLRGFNKEENRSVKQQYLDWTKNLHQSIISLKEVGHKFIRQATKIIQTDNYIVPLHERIAKAKDYFLPLLTDLKDEIRKHKSQLKDKKKIKTYIRELEEFESLLFNYIRQMMKLSLLVSNTRDNKILTKSMLHQSLMLHPNIKPPKSSKIDKTPTAEISFELFKQGKSVEEIAGERGFVEGTILGHLCQFIETGEIDAAKIIDGEKLKNIIKVHEAGHEKSSEIKAVLSDDYSYGEIKVALAHIRSLASISQKPKT